jgi:polar amino acid transport system ATP-binding protein
MIKIENLSKKFAKEIVLKNISFELIKNQTTVILGPSGSGKSTLLRCIKFLETITSGGIYISGQMIKNQHDPLLNKVGLVFQNFNLFPHLNVRENLLYATSFIADWPKEAKLRLSEELLIEFALLSKSLSMPKDLSGGQKQRVAIARALMMRPDILLFDEPTSALDQETTFGLVKFLQKLRKDISLLIVTHDMKFARMLADRIIFMDHGQILCDQTSSDFFLEPDSHRARLFMEQESCFDE